jgi:hypothetical protein
MLAKDKSGMVIAESPEKIKVKESPEKVKVKPSPEKTIKVMTDLVVDLPVGFRSTRLDF